MHESFKALGGKPWEVTDSAVIFNGTACPFAEITSMTLVTTTSSSLMNGIAQMVYKGDMYVLAFRYADKDRAQNAITFVKDAIEVAHGVVKDYKYRLSSHTGTYLEAYEDYLMIHFMPVGSVVASITRGGNAGGKKLNYSDITTIQFVEPTATTAGFMSFSYPGNFDIQGGVMAAVNDENSIIFRADLLPLAKEIKNFIEQRRAELKATANAPVAVVQQVSVADELKKFKELLDMGIISQEEFDAKKKQLLGLC